MRRVRKLFVFPLNTRERGYARDVQKTPETPKPKPTRADAIRHEPTQNPPEPPTQTPTQAPTKRREKGAPRPERVRGVVKWVVESVVNGARSRKYFDTEAEAVKHWRAIKGVRADLGDLLRAIPSNNLGPLLEAHRLAAAHKVSLFEAVDFFIRRHGHVEQRFVEDARKEFVALKEKETGLRPRSVGALKSTVSRFEVACGVLYLHEVEASTVRAWLNTLDVKPITRNGILGDLHNFFGWCERMGYIRENPATIVDKALVDGKRIVVHSPEDVGKFLEAVRVVCPKLLAHVAIAYLAGLRVEAELKHLTWREVDRKAGLIRPDRTKTRRPRNVPISDNLGAWLDEAERLGATLPARNTAKLLFAARAKAGVSWPRNVMRKSFATYHYEQHGDAALTAKASGHSVQVLLDNYADVVLPEEAAAFWAIMPGDYADAI